MQSLSTFRPIEQTSVQSKMLTASLVWGGRACVGHNVLRVILDKFCFYPDLSESKYGCLVIAVYSYILVVVHPSTDSYGAIQNECSRHFEGKELALIYSCHFPQMILVVHVISICISGNFAIACNNHASPCQVAFFTTIRVYINAFRTWDSS